jgi:hypothetical protein
MRIIKEVYQQSNNKQEVCICKKIGTHTCCDSAAKVIIKGMNFSPIYTSNETQIIYNRDEL